MLTWGWFYGVVIKWVISSIKPSVCWLFLRNRTQFLPKNVSGSPPRVAPCESITISWLKKEKYWSLLPMPSGLSPGRALMRGSSLKWTARLWLPPGREEYDLQQFGLRSPYVVAIDAGLCVLPETMRRTSRRPLELKPKATCSEETEFAGSFRKAKAVIFSLIHSAGNTFRETFTKNCCDKQFNHLSAKKTWQNRQRIINPEAISPEIDKGMRNICNLEMPDQLAKLLRRGVAASEKRVCENFVVSIGWQQLPYKLSQQE